MEGVSQPRVQQSRLELRLGVVAGSELTKSICDVIRQLSESEVAHIFKHCQVGVRFAPTPQISGESDVRRSNALSPPNLYWKSVCGFRTTLLTPGVACRSMKNTALRDAPLCEGELIPTHENCSRSGRRVGRRRGVCHLIRVCVVNRDPHLSR